MGWDIEMVRLCRQGQQKKGGKETKQKRKKDPYGINSLVSSEVTLFFLSSPKTDAFFPIILLLKWAGGRSGWCRSPLLRFSMRVLSQRQMQRLLLMWINQMCHIWLIILNYLPKNNLDQLQSWWRGLAPKLGPFCWCWRCVGNHIM